MKRKTFNTFVCITLSSVFISAVLTLSVRSDNEGTSSISPPTALAPAKRDESLTTLDVIEPIYYECPLDNNLQDYIRKMCEENGIPMSLVLAVISVESSFRDWVISGTNDYGLMQINKSNHRWFYEEYGITDFLDPYQNVFCGITLLAQHYNKYQDDAKALMAYNHGATGARRLWNKGIYETTYTRKVISTKEEFDNEIQPSGR